MKLFFDTNVVIDHAMMRPTGQPYETSYLIYWAARHQYPIFISPCCIYSITYVLHKGGIRGEDLKQMLKEYVLMFDICDSNKQLFLDGLNTNFKDLKDSFQYVHALREECDYLITSNITDFKPYVPGKMKVLSPSEFVSQVLKKKPYIDF